jgi:hypothetical protein
MLRTFALALTVPLVSAAHGLHNPWIHGVSGCTSTECCAAIKTGLCKGNTCDDGIADPTECRGREEPDIVCANHPYLKKDKAAGTVGRTYTACCRSMCSDYDRCNTNDEYNTNKFGYMLPTAVKTHGTDATWEASIVKGSRVNPVAVDAGTALGNDPEHYYNKYTFGAARKTQAAGTTAHNLLPAGNTPGSTCAPTDVEYQPTTAKTTCCASTCNNFRFITSIKAAAPFGPRSHIALSDGSGCQHPGAGLNQFHPTAASAGTATPTASTTQKYTDKPLQTECAGITCTLEECCTANPAPAPAPPLVQKITTPTCTWTVATAGNCGAAIPATAAGTRADKECGSGGMARSTRTLNAKAAKTTCCMADATGACAGACAAGSFTATDGTCTIPAGYTADTTFNTANTLVTTGNAVDGSATGFRVYKDEPCCLKACGVDCVGAMKSKGCSVECGTGTQQEIFEATTDYVAGKIACTPGVTVVANAVAGTAGYTCSTTGYRLAQTCTAIYTGATWRFTVRDISPAVACNTGECCNTWLSTNCGTNEAKGTLQAHVTAQAASVPPKGCCSPGSHPGAAPTTTMGSSSSQCCVADVSNKCFSGAGAGTEVNTVTGVSGTNTAVTDVTCPGAGATAWTQKKTATCDQVGPNRIVNDAGAYANIYACCVPPNDLDASFATTPSAETKNENTDNWCKGVAGTARLGYGTTAGQDGRNGVLATTAATSTHVHNQLGSYVSTPLSYVCPTTHSLKDYEAPKKEPNNCAEECVVRTDAWIDCIASPAQTEKVACDVPTTWYGTRKAGFTNIGGLDGAGAANGAVCPHTPNTPKCQEKVNAMYESCHTCAAASYTVGATNTPGAASACPIGSTCPPVVSSWGPAGKTLFDNTIAADGSLTKGAAVTDQLWALGVAKTVLKEMITETGIGRGQRSHLVQGYGGTCTIPTFPPCPTHVPKVGTKDTMAISQCPEPTTALSATTPTKVLAADAYTAMPALATAMVVAVAAVVF